MAKISYKIILLILLLLCSFTDSYTQDFFGQTPFIDGEKVQLMAVDQNDNLYVGIWGKGIQKSTNGGSNFVPVNTGLTNLLIRDLTVTKNGKMYAATYGGGIFRSLNGGSSWTAVNIGLSSLLTTSIKEFPTGLLVAGTYGHGVFISTNDGNNWAPSNKGLSYKAITGVEYTRNGYILVSTYGGGLYQSRDTAKTWKKSNSGLGNLFINGFVKDAVGDIYVSTNGKGIYVTVNDGISWGQAVEDSTMLDKNVTAFTISQSNELMIGTRNGGLQYYDKDIWKKWQSPFNPLLGATAMTKSSNNRIYAAGSQPEIYLSTNNGRNFSQLGSIRTHSFSFVASPRPSHVFGQYDGKSLYYSSDYGKSWTLTNLPNTKINALISTNLNSYVIGAANGLYTSVDGTNWTKHSRFVDTSITSIDYLNGFMIVSSYYQYMPIPPPPPPPAAPVIRMHISTDNGTSFTQKTFPSFNAMCTKLKIALDGTIYSLEGDSLFKSNDNSTSWSKITVTGFPPLHVKDLDVNNSNQIFLATDKGVLRSLDYGSTWIYNKLTYLKQDTLGTLQIKITPSGKIFAVAAIQRDIIPAFGIWYSNDSGVSWDSINSSVTSNEFIKLASDPDDNLYMSSHGIFKSFNSSKMPAPLIIAPADNSKGLLLDPLFSWNSAEKAELYEMQISDDQTFVFPHEWIIQADTTHQIQKLLDYNKTYYWRVRSKTDGSYSPWSNTATLSTMLNSPELITPANNSTGVSSKPSYVWHSVLNTKVYEIQVATDNLFTNLVFSADSLKDTTVLSADLQSDKTYYWHVRAKNDYSVSPWSTTWIFKTTFGPPDLIFPPNDTLNIDINPTLLWSSVGNATYFKVKYSSNSDLSGVQPIKVDGKNMHSIADLEYDTKYYWQVLTGSIEGESLYSQIWHFSTKVSPVVLAAPSTGSINQSISPELSWNKNGNYSQYQILVSKEPDFSIIVADTVVNGIQKVTIPRLEGYITYYWKVRVFSSTKIGYWSDVWSFTTMVANPFLRFPDNHGKNLPSTLSFLWFPSQGAEYYFLQIARDPEFNDLIYSKDSIQSTTHEVEGLAFKTHYYWRVRASNPNGFSFWSDIWDFETSDVVPILVNPKNNEILTGPPVILKWKPVEGALTYFLQISLKEDFTELEISEEGLSDTSFTFADFKSKVKYFWRVKARFSGVETNWSSIWNFTVDNMSVEEFVNNSSILSISPNPVSSKSKVLFDSPFSGNYSISIIDINGNAIFSLFKGFLSSGINEFEFDAKTLSNGTYLIVASNLKTVYYSKISIIK